MSRLTVVIVGALTSIVVAGCAVTRENQSSCKASATVLGALVGGGAVGAGVGVGTSDEAARACVGVGGAIVGGLVGYALGNHFCQLPEAPPPPPASPPAPPMPRKIETLTGPSFAFNKATLTAEGRQHVEHAAQVMRDNPMLRVTVEGHTDSVGTHAYNMKLSQRRAAAVRDYMVARGIDAARISTEAYGETRPVATNDTAEGRAQNRRVEIIAQ